MKQSVRNRKRPAPPPVIEHTRSVLLPDNRWLAVALAAGAVNSFPGAAGNRNIQGTPDDPDEEERATENAPGSSSGKSIANSIPGITNHYASTLISHIAQTVKETIRQATDGGKPGGRLVNATAGNIATAGIITPATPAVADQLRFQAMRNTSVLNLLRETSGMEVFLQNQAAIDNTQGSKQAYEYAWEIKSAASINKPSILLPVTSHEAFTTHLPTGSKILPYPFDTNNNTAPVNPALSRGYNAAPNAVNSDLAETPDENNNGHSHVIHVHVNKSFVEHFSIHTQHAEQGYDQLQDMVKTIFLEILNSVNAIN